MISRIIVNFTLATAMLVTGMAAQAHTWAGEENDFAEGSGWVNSSYGDKAMFGIAAECEGGGFEGHFRYKDKALNLRVRDATITSISSDGANKRVIEGTGRFEGSSSFDSANGHFRAEVVDNGRKGKDTDSFQIEFSTGYASNGLLGGGNIHVHVHAGTADCPADETPPTVSITAPSDGSTVSGTVTITADASDNDEVAGVQFFVDGTAIGAEDTSAPYSVSWDSTTVADGSHSLTAEARDAAGNTTTSSAVSVTVDNAPDEDTTPPTVSITAPSDGSTVSGTVTVSADAADDRDVAGVQFFVDGTAIGAEDTSAPYSVSWDTTTAADGSHSLTAEARDAAGNTTTSSAVSVTVDNGGGGSGGGSGTAVTWTDRVNVTASGNSIEKTAGCNGCEDAGATSVETIASGDGFVEFTVAETTTSRVIGLSQGNADTSRADIDFGIQLWAGGGADVRENGTYRAESGTYASGDVFRIAVESGVVNYYKNGTRFYSSGMAPTYPLRVDTSLWDTGATASDVVIGSGSSGSDTTAPTVSLTNPADGSTVSGTVTVSADASDNDEVAGVQFFVDGTAIGAEDTSAPYSVSWDTTTVADGSHSLTAEARDAAGNTTTSSAVSVTVDNAPEEDTTPPTVSVTNPADGATVSGTVTVSADASDASGIEVVEFLLDGTRLGSLDTTSPYEVLWDTTAVADGSHTLQARARDNAGNIGESTVITVTVSNGGGSDTTPPSVSITSPADGSTVSGSVTIGADAADDTSVAGVQFFVDGTAVGVEDTAEPYEVSWDTTTVADGSHSLTAEARDAAGNTTTSSAVSVTVDNGGGSGGTTIRIEETDPSIAYAGSWQTVSDSRLSGGTGTETLEAGDTATVSFEGTGIEWIGVRCSCTAGVADVFVDGAFAATVDGDGSATPETQVVIFSVSGLAPGTHTLRIEVTGRAARSDASAWVLIDAFDITQ